MTAEPYTLSRNCNYGCMDFWDARYGEFPIPFEWYLGYDNSSLKDIIRTYCRKDGRVLIVGCGNSIFSEQMSNDGYNDIHNIDFSQCVVDQMKLKYEGNSSLKWEQMNCIKMTFENEVFDYVIDKGTLDCVFCTSDAENNVRSYCSEVERILKSGGKFIVISSGSMESRLEIFENNDIDSDYLSCFDCTVSAIEKTRDTSEDYSVGTGSMSFDEQNYFVYLCRKDDTKVSLK